MVVFNMADVDLEMLLQEPIVPLDDMARDLQEEQEWAEVVKEGEGLPAVAGIEQGAHVEDPPREYLNGLLVKRTSDVVLGGCFISVDHPVNSFKGDHTREMDEPTSRDDQVSFEEEERISTRRKRRRTNKVDFALLDRGVSIETTLSSPRDSNSEYWSSDNISPCSSTASLYSNCSSSNSKSSTASRREHRHSVNNNKNAAAAARFVWTRKNHAAFLSGTFNFGLQLDRPFELLFLLGNEKPDESAIAVLQNALMFLRKNKQRAEQIFLRQLDLTQDLVLNDAAKNHKAQVEFHCYPFCSRMAEEQMNFIPGFPDTLRFIAAVFDIGFQHARPKGIIKGIGCLPEGMNRSHVKSKLQKYRRNAHESRADFWSQYGVKLML